MTKLLNEVVIPALDRLGAPFLRDPALSSQAFVPIGIDEHHGVRSLVHVVANDTSGDLRLWTNLLAVRKARHSRVLELCNRINGERRWLKFALLDEAVIAQTDVELSFSSDAQSQFILHFVGFTEALAYYWPELLRTASERRRRSRVQRDVEGVLKRLEG